MWWLRWLLRTSGETPSSLEFSLYPCRAENESEARGPGAEPMGNSACVPKVTEDGDSTCPPCFAVTVILGSTAEAIALLPWPMVVTEALSCGSLFVGCVVPWSLRGPFRLAGAG